ncbi:MAG: hypothetical protein HY741_07885 [Chloroflexi bacterium]|nr:hypothetical protein [Chloroflexota bacterium]
MLHRNQNTRTSNQLCAARLGIWFICLASGAILGAALDWTLHRTFLLGLANGIVVGHFLATALNVHLRIASHTSPPLDRAARLLPPTLAVVAIIGSAEILRSHAGTLSSLLYPWHGLGVLAICIVSALLLYRQRIYLAAILLLIGLYFFVSVTVFPYGMNSPIYALYLLLIVLGGLLLGRSGFVDSVAGAVVQTGLFGWGEWV